MYLPEPCNILRHRRQARPGGQSNSSVTPGAQAVPTQLILASSSPFRKQLLDRLQLDFECMSPDVDESILVDETAVEYVRRLALSKARVIAQQHGDAIVIGSDQCAVLEGEIIGKPGNHARALQQLRRAQGKCVRFHTAVCVLRQTGAIELIEEVPFEVEFRQLSDRQLEHYLRVEQPYQCAGSFMAEGYGACLFKRMRGDDPNALVGLPLFKLIEMLEAVGVEVV